MKKSAPDIQHIQNTASQNHEKTKEQMNIHNDGPQNNNVKKRSRLSDIFDKVPSPGRLFFVFIVAVLMLGIVWYMFQHRQVFICTDTLWNEAFLSNDHRMEQLKIVLWNNFYIPTVHTVAFEEANQETIMRLCRSKTGGVFLFSPYLSLIADIEQLTAEFPNKRFVLWESSIGEDKYEGRETSTASSQVVYLSIETGRLASVFTEALEDVLSGTNEANERMRIVWNHKGWLSEEDVRFIQHQLEASFPDVQFTTVDTTGSRVDREDLRISQDDILLILDAETEQLQQLLSRIKNRGAQSIVFGEGAIAGWSEGVTAEIRIDFKATIEELLNATRDGTFQVQDSSDQENAPQEIKKTTVQRFAIRFTIRR